MVLVWVVVWIALPIATICGFATLFARFERAQAKSPSFEEYVAPFE